MSLMRLKRVARSLRTPGFSGPYVGLEDVESGTGRFSPNVAEDEPASAIAFRQGDVLYGKLRPYLRKVLQPEFDGRCSSEFLVLRPLPEVDPHYLKFVMLSEPVAAWAAANSGGARMPRVEWDLIGQFDVRIPTLAEQQAIADYLDRETTRIDALIEKRRLLIGLLSEREMAIRTSLVLEDEQGKAYPRVRLKFLVPRIGVGLVINPSTYAIDDGVPFLHGSHITPEGIVFEPPKYMSDHDSKALSASRLHAGDVVVVRAGYPGRAVVVPPEYEGANCASILIIRRGGQLIPEFLTNYLNSADGARQVSLVQYGAAQEQINVGHIVNFMVPAPELEQQASALMRIDATCGRLARARRKIEDQIAVLDKKRQALITAAVTGRIDIPGAA